MGEELKPCPFCGCDDPYIRAVEVQEPSDIYEICVECDDCETRGPLHLLEAADVGTERERWLRDSAARRWNRRATLAEDARHG